MESGRSSQANNVDLLRLLVSCVKDYALFIIDTDGYILSWNEGAQRIKGYTADEIIGKHFSIFYPEEDKAACKPQMELIEAARVGRFEDTGWRIRKDGSPFWANVVITALRDENGVLRGFGKVTRDITERLVTEDTLKLARDQAVDAAQFKSDFLARMSHEIRTPMNGILGMTEILSRTNLEDKQRAYLSTIQEAGVALLTVINDILDFSKIEAGKLTLEPVSFNLLKLVEGVGELFSLPARSKGLSFMIFIDPEIPAGLLGDPNRLRQILSNLVSNAIKFSDHGEITLEVTTLASDEKSWHLRFAVTDRGVGISDEDKRDLFKPFVQAQESRRFGGTGLGLSISKSLVEMMGGEIGLESTPGSGSTFWVTAEFSRTEPVPPRVTQLPDLRGLNVLVVDDEPSARDILHKYLMHWGMKCDSAPDAQDALRMLRQAQKVKPYDVAIIDLALPSISGAELGKLIRDDSSLKDLKLVLITAFDAPGTSEESRFSGFSAYLTKPIKQSELMDCLASVMHGTEPKHEKGNRERTRDRDTLTTPRRGELILVVEDHAINQQVALLLLSDLGFEAHIADNGRAALEAIQRSSYALVLMDVQMPEMNGFEATRALRKLETQSGRHVPVIAMTAHAIEGSREDCLSAGMDDYISKPIDPEALRKVINKYIPPVAEKAQNPQPINELVAIDLPRLEKRFGTKQAERLVNMFMSDAPLQIHKIREALDERDLKKIKEAAHGLKGICAAVYAEKMRALNEAIEAACVDQDYAAIGALTGDLQKAFGEMEEALKNWRTMP